MAASRRLRLAFGFGAPYSAMTCERRDSRPLIAYASDLSNDLFRRRKSRDSVIPMSRPKVCVLRAPGTNCDVETAFAFESCGADAQRVHLFRVLETPQILRDYQILCVPGGFSYGDDVGAGVIFAAQLRVKLGEILSEFLTADKLALGICNGFQVLLKAGVLPGGTANWRENAEEPEATLTWNDNGKYTARWVTLGCAGSRSVFLREIDEIELPIAHAEGRLVVREDSILDNWLQQGQIAVCYAQPAAASSPLGELTTLQIPYPDNPNGSVANVAGLCDPSGRVLGLMPHPERFLHGTQHPRWTRGEISEEGAGTKIFRNAVEYFG